MHTIESIGPEIVPGNDGSWNQLVNKINNFHVLCVYDRDIQRDSREHLRNYANDILQGKQDEIPIFDEKPQAESFFIWDDMYQANRPLFYKIRQSARDDLIYRISTRLGAYFLQEYSPLITSSVSKHPELKNKDLLDKTITKLENQIRRSTFLADEAAWEKFCSWIKYYLAIQALRDLETDMGRQELEAMSNQELNELFSKTMTTNLLMNTQFIHGFTKYTEQYLQHWIKQFITLLDVDNVSLTDVKTFLEIKRKDEIDTKGRLLKKNVPLSLVREDHILVMSNPVYQAVREALSNHRFKNGNDFRWPTAKVSQTTIEGIVQIIPASLQNKNPTKKVLQETEGYVHELSELVVDVFDILCSYFLTQSNYRHDVVEINIQDLLHIRGLKPKLGGNGRRGGFEKEQLEQVVKALVIIQNAWIDLSRAVVYEKGKSKQIHVKGRAFIFLDSSHQPSDVRKEINKDKYLRFTVGKSLDRFLIGSNRQVALLPIQTLHYHIYREEWEKKLSRYLSWRWRTQARKGEYLKPHKVDRLLQKIDKTINQQTPSRTRDRFEQALDQLQSDHIIEGWEYVDWDESVASYNGWSRIWRQTKIVITPAKEIKQHYQSIRKNKVSSIVPQSAHTPIPVDHQEKIGIQLRAYRKKLGLTLLQVAEELELSAAYISTIERGKKIPSSKVIRNIEAFMQ